METKAGKNHFLSWILLVVMLATLTACKPEPPQTSEEEPVDAAQLRANLDQKVKSAVSGGGQKALPGHYQDGFLLAEDDTPDFSKDIKHVETLSHGLRLTDYPTGYKVTLPEDMEIDLRFSPDFTRAYNPSLEMRVSRDRSPYQDVRGWLSGLPNEFITLEEYRLANDIAVHEDKWETVNGLDFRLFSLTRSPGDGSHQTMNSYTYAYVQTQGLIYYTFNFKCTSFEENRDTIHSILESFEATEVVGNCSYCLDLQPVLPEWNQETAAYFDTVSSSQEVTWGFFTPNAFGDEGQAKIAEIEDNLSYRFPVILVYRYLQHEFPTEGMEEAYNDGKIVELTYQIAGDMEGHNPNFDVLDGLRDDDIRRLAQEAKEFGHPFLFRLNNEMNSTWVSYSGHLSLCDPDIFREVWIRFYEIFREEGVDNAIWVFNPNDVSFPPCKWNSHIAYYPGDEYVHMIGVTGYNTGDYFKNVTGERWRPFSEIYDRLWEMYKHLYAEFPWMITEFACSSVGGDKLAWIQDMFLGMPKYPNIKIAVWWSYYDPDPRPATKGTPARRYWLDESPEYLEAFRQGLGT